MNNTAAESSAWGAEKSKVGYQFTAIPTQLMYLCDVNVRSALFTLIQISSEYADADGWFFRTNEDLQIDMKLSQHLVVATVDALYRKGIVSVRPKTKKKKGVKTPPNDYRVNFDKFKEYESMDFNSLRNPELVIETMKYRERGYKAQYMADAETSEIQTYSPPTEKVPTNIDNTDTTNTIKSYEHIADNSNTLEMATPSSEVIETTEPQSKPISEYEQRGQQFKERNAAISELFRKMEADIALYKSSKTETYTADNANKVSKAIQWGYEHKDFFTQRQWDMFIRKETAFRKLAEHKAAYFQRGRNGKIKQQSQTETVIMETPKPTENKNHIPPTPISDDAAIERASTDEMSWDDKFWNDLEKAMPKQTMADEFLLNSDTLRYEDMTDAERADFEKSIYDLTEKGEILRYIKAHKWLRNKDDADRLFETFHEKVIDYVGTDIDAQNKFIEVWNRYCEKAA